METAEQVDIVNSIVDPAFNLASYPLESPSRILKWHTYTSQQSRHCMHVAVSSYQHLQAFDGMFIHYIPMGKCITLLCLLLNSFRTVWSFHYTAIVQYRIPGSCTYNFRISQQLLQTTQFVCWLLVGRKLLREGTLDTAQFSSTAIVACSTNNAYCSYGGGLGMRLGWTQSCDILQSHFQTTNPGMYRQIQMEIFWFQDYLTAILFNLKHRLGCSSPSNSSSSKTKGLSSERGYVKWLG